MVKRRQRVTTHSPPEPHNARLCVCAGGVQQIMAGVKGSYVDTEAAHLFLNLRMDNRCAGFRGGILFPVEQSPGSSSLV